MKPWYKSGTWPFTPPVRSPAPVPQMPPVRNPATPAATPLLAMYLDEIQRATDRGLAATNAAQLRDALRSVEYFHTLASDLLAKIEGNQE